MGGVLLSRRGSLGTGAVPITPIAPDAITGLQAWYKAETIAQADATAVSAWNDSTANGRNLTQATGTSQPLYQTAIVNGLPVVRFDGVNDFMRSGAFTLNQPKTFAIVAKATAPNGGYYIDGLTINTHAMQRFNGTTYRLYAGSVLDVAVAEQSAFHIVIATFNGASSRLWFNGGTGATGGTGAAAGSGLTVGIGGNGTSTPLVGDIGEICVYNTAVAVSDVNGLGQHLASRFGLSWSAAT